MDKKYGVYICTGCGIGDALDIEGCAEVAQEEGFPAQTHPFLCGKEGSRTVQKRHCGKRHELPGYRRLFPPGEL
jgi:quinone-modifying oxidoreductase, subunit QmoB